MRNRAHEPVYRPVLREAFTIAWREKRLWLFGVFAGILLTGSIADVVWKKVNIFGDQGSVIKALFPFWSQAMNTWSHFSLTDLVIGSLNAFLVTAFFLVVAFAIFGASVISQGTIVYTIGSTKNPSKTDLRKTLAVGAKALWPILVLNLLVIATLLATRSVIAIALAYLMSVSTIFAYFLFIFSFVVFTLLAIVATIIEIFALNAMMLQGATLAQGLERGYEILRKHWIVIAEIAGLLFLISVGLYVLMVISGLIIAIPFGILLIVSALLKSGLLFACVSLFFVFAFILAVLAIFGFNVLLQYATWTIVFKKFGEGGVLPKIHRITRSWLHRTRVPGA